MKKVNLKSIIEYMLVLISIIECNSVYTRTIEIEFYTNYLEFFVVGIFSMFVLTVTPKIKKKKAMLIILLECYFLLFYFLTNSTQLVFFILKFIVLFSILLIYFENESNLKNIMEKYSNVVFVLALISCFFYIFGTLTEIIPPKKIMINWGGIKQIDNFAFIHFSTQAQKIFNINVKRNTGIFTEAPMYAFVLIVAFLKEKIYPAKKSNVRKRIYILTIFSTISITGILCVVIIEALDYVLNNKKKDKIYLLFKILFLPILILAVIVIFKITIINKQENDHASYSVRMDDYKASFFAWKEHPILGNGFNNESVTQRYMEDSRNENLGQSNAIGKIAAEGGIILIALYLLPLILNAINAIKKKDYGVLIAVITCLILLITTNIPYTNIMIIIETMCINKLYVNRLEKIKGARIF